MTQEQMWVPGAIFRMNKEGCMRHGELCVFLDWDEDYLDEDYDYRFPRMKFSDGYIEDFYKGIWYDFVSNNRMFQYHSLL